MTDTVGILADGSLIGDPGPAATLRTKQSVETPFIVEFVRTGSRRRGAPTSVRVDGVGIPVIGTVFGLDLLESEATNCLWRREIHSLGNGRGYVAREVVGPNTVVIRRLERLADADIVLYADTPANIRPLILVNLVRLAIESIRKVSPGCNGISYSIAVEQNGISTGLSADYEAQILRQWGCKDIAQVIGNLRGAAT
jgi:hypothetical protein